MIMILAGDCPIKRKIKAVSHRFLKTEFVKYFSIGVLAVLLDNLTFFLSLRFFDVSLLGATITALLVGFIVSFLGNKLLVFIKHEHTAKHNSYMQLSLYTLLFIFNTAFTYGFVFLTAEHLGIDEIIAKLFTTIIITGWNFVLYKAVIFKLENRT